MGKSKYPKKDCQCDKCVRACKSQPGWFAPGEAEKAAKFYEIPFDVFKEMLIIDYWIKDNSDYDNKTYVYAPRKIGIEENSLCASWGYTFKEAPCIFLEKGKCLIHKAKPFECRHSMPCDDNYPTVREDVVKIWQKKVYKLKHD